MTIIRHLHLAFRIASAAIAQACLWFVHFWNIPALGEMETTETRHARTTYRI